MAAAVRILELLIVLAVVGWVLDGPRALGASFYTEQLLALVLGLSVALAFLVYPRSRVRVPWWDWLAAAAALAAFGYVAVRFDALVTDVGMQPSRYLPLALAMVLLVLETTRRSTGMSLIWYTAVGVDAPVNRTLHALVKLREAGDDLSPAERTAPP